jgi:AcrR family transcriptional regulator
MNEIAHRAGVSVGTVYNYFNDKQCLLFYLKRNLAKHVISQLTLHAEANLSPIEKLDKITDTIFSFQSEYGFIYEISEQTKLDYEENEVVANLTHTIDLIQRILDEGVAQNKFKKMNTRRTAQMLILSYIGAIILRPVLKKKKSFFSYHLMLNNFYSLIRNKECHCGS